MTSPLPGLPAPPASLGGAPDRFGAFLAGQLAPGETVLWRAQPLPATYPRVMRGALWVFQGFIALWLLGVSVMAIGGIIQEVRAARWGGAAAFLGGGAVMLGGGLAMLRIVGRARDPVGDCHYVLTDQRALICLPRLLRGYHTRVFLPYQLKATRRSGMQPDGSGDLVFTIEWVKDDGEEVRHDVGFHRIPDAEKVEGLLRQMLAHTFPPRQAPPPVP